MRRLLFIVLVLATVDSHAGLPVRLLPQLHRPLGQSWARTSPIMRTAVVSSQTEILNLLYEGRGTRQVVFTEANDTRLTSQDGSAPIVRHHTVFQLGEAFRDLDFPIRAERLSYGQQFLLFSSGAAAVALSLGWVDEMPVTESKGSQRKTAYRVTMDSFALISSFFRRRGPDQDFVFRNPLASAAIFGTREQQVLARVLAHHRADVRTDAAVYSIIFGAEHEFPDATSLGVDLERVDTRSKEILEEHGVAAARQLEEQLASCEELFADLPANPGVFGTLRALRKASKAARAKARR